MLALLQKGKEGGKKSKMEMNSHLCVQIKAAELFNFLPLLDLQKRKKKGREEKVGEIRMDESVCVSVLCLFHELLFPLLAYSGVHLMSHFWAWPAVQVQTHMCFCTEWITTWKYFFLNMFTKISKLKLNGCEVALRDFRSLICLKQFLSVFWLIHAKLFLAIMHFQSCKYCKKFFF